MLVQCQNIPPSASFVIQEKIRVQIRYPRRSDTKSFESGSIDQGARRFSRRILIVRAARISFWLTFLPKGGNVPQRNIRFATKGKLYRNEKTIVLPLESGRPVGKTELVGRDAFDNARPCIREITRYENFGGLQSKAPGIPHARPSNGTRQAGPRYERGVSPPLDESVAETDHGFSGSNGTGFAVGRNLDSPYLGTENDTWIFIEREKQIRSGSNEQHRQARRFRKFKSKWQHFDIVHRKELENIPGFRWRRERRPSGYVDIGSKERRSLHA